ncbi:cation efflux family protein [Podospora aff. communis PSN243]|uniref:Cation efflux family protein n=1 Tax=Podospora aff. communis PSN243 TaxID=3040156 RepID=A0AAV9H3W3_9PEZI|nr:cation efflux family protein [Podospora aff. communis PSN243]
MGFRLGARQKLIATIAIYFSFFVAELAVALSTRSLALTADAFHYLNDLIGFVVALVAVIVKDRKKPDRGPYTFGWQRSPIIGAFFNGAFLAALGVSIFFQSVERFLSTNTVDNTILVLVMGCVGLALNILSAVLLHDHHGHSHGHGHAHCHTKDQGIDLQDVEGQGPPKDTLSISSEESFEQTSPEFHRHHHHFRNSENGAAKRDLGMLGVLTHVLCDAINNVGVIIAAAVMTFTTLESRFYADPAVSMGIALMILVSAMPLLSHSGAILLQSAPAAVDAKEVQEDLEMIPGVISVHELHIWQLDENKAIASAHLVFSDPDASRFTYRAQLARECLHAYGIHSATLQPEFLLPRAALQYQGTGKIPPCLGVCSAACEEFRCCNEPQQAMEFGESASSSAKGVTTVTAYAASNDKTYSL